MFIIVYQSLSIFKLQNEIILIELVSVNIKLFITKIVYNII